ncbi:leucine-rich repeat domain-containing protein [Hoylesella buccalis]|uniref:leucine-rich repeat domain-containing protein n=1 Tax=Hoylesella buccalis TaxID=28127 RepID=UPI0006918BAB|nr:leucine-rich repeat domain-containing protein [Hoylesella buccalis]
MMKQNYNNKAKHRSAWFALVLLMITALPITAQNKGERFQVDNGYWYEVVDATAKTVKVTWANKKATTAEARQQVLKRYRDDLPNEWKAYSGNPKHEVEKEPKVGSSENDKNKINVINIPEKVSYNSKEWTVVAIGSYAFINERKINKMVLPETIETIEDAAFYQCSVITLNFPANLKYIGWRAFYKTNLEPYKMEKVLKPNGDFRRWKQDKLGIAIPGKTAIGPQAFEGSFSKAQFLCPNITFLGYQAFKGNKFDITTPIPATAKIGEQPTDPEIKAMYANLPGVDMESGAEAFTQYNGSVTLKDGITTIPKGMFENAFKDLAQFVIPSTVTSIEERAFANAGIKSFNDLSTVTKIGARAFENGALSGDFVILDNVEEIGDGAFKGNVNLAGFTLKGSTNCKVGAGILEGCTGLEFFDLRDVNNTEVKNSLKNLSREANSSTITKGLPTHTLVYLPNVSDISIATGQDVNFVKFDGKCTKLVLVDGEDYEFPYAITATDVVYQRDFPSFIDGKNCFTIFLPYAVKLPKGIRAYNLDFLRRIDTGNNDGYGQRIYDDTYMFKSIPDEGILEANRPYLLRIVDGKNHSAEEFEAIASPVKIAASGTDKLSKSKLLKPRCFVKGDSDQSYAFYGNTEKTSNKWFYDDDLTNGLNYEFSPWVLNIDSSGKDVWRQFSDKNTYYMPPFRGAIMRIPGTSGAKQFMVLSEDETTGINDVTNDAEVQQGAQRIYTMDGHYVGTNFDSLPSGMYIMKGKKTLKTK